MDPNPAESDTPDQKGYSKKSDHTCYMPLKVGYVFSTSASTITHSTDC